MPVYKHGCMYVCALVYENICMHELRIYLCRYTFMYKPLQEIMRWQSQPVGLGGPLPLCSLKETSNIHIAMYIMDNIYSNQRTHVGDSYKTEAFS